ncbi:hypothetical protein FB45DRAFT_1019304 [Roridomyces roridus]|uniref:BTB domain-containing protein n=1 Tax=Roridomyces roridus TaxID=1738132 RepID=A0AAD7CF16_9AGAR|nr:hypothetical protein FB45DRAFT_1019304 [Roridomyces roridus]
MADFKDASPPFSPTCTISGLNPDLILRSSDSVDFYVHKALLGFVSPVFRDMFAFPPPTDATLVEGVDVRNGIHVVQLTEPSDALQQLLFLCYPQAVTNQPPDTLDGLHFAYGAADKYQVPDARDKILHTLSNANKTDPYRVFAIACILGLPDLARAAAQKTLQDVRVPMSFNAYSAPEYKLISADKLLQLARFHWICSIETFTAVQCLGLTLSLSHDKEAPWWTSSGHDSDCGASWMGDECIPPKWYRQHMATVQEAVKLRPNGESAWSAVLDYTTTCSDVLSECKLCSRESAAHMAALAVTVRKQVDRVNKKMLARLESL